jgi:hypothetical protein
MANDPVYDKLNLRPISNKSIELVPLDKNKGEQLSDDLDEARTNTRHLINVGEEALKELQDLSSQSQDPKAYRELSVLIKVMLDANKSLVDTARARKEIVVDADKVVSDNPQTVTNNLYVGTTTDAVDILKQKRSIKDD